MATAKRAKIDSLFEIVSTRKAFKSALLQLELKPRRQISDLLRFLNELKIDCQSRLEELIDKHKGIKVWMALDVEYAPIDNANKIIAGYLRTKAMTYRNTAEIEDCVQKQMKELEYRNANFMRAQSGLALKAIKSATICVSKHQPLVGRAFKDLPRILKENRSIINVQNKDNRCFGYAILSALHPVERNHFRPQNYDPFFEVHGLHSINYPVSLEDVPALEERLQLAINIFSFFDDEGMGKYPLYVSRRDDATTIDLLYWSGHYAWIKNFDKFMFSITKHESRKFICKRCFGHFNEEGLLKQHQFLCDREDFSSQIFTMPPPGKTLKFKNIRYQLPIPFVIYADFECITEHSYPDGDEPAHGTYAYQNHIPCSVGLKLVSRVGDLADIQYLHHTGPDASAWFLEQLLELQEQIKVYLFDDHRLIMTNADQRAFDAAQICSICAKPLYADKVRDHDHFTGKYRGAAHSKCNIQMRKTYKVPIFLHNFRGYDAHLIVLAMAHFPLMEIKVIGQGYEKYLTVAWGDHFVFKDSLQFMACSLEQLACNLKKSGAEHFKQLVGEFGVETEEKKAQVELILRKGVYPYDYMDSWGRFQEVQLPTIEAFASRLRNSMCTEAEYEHAQRVWAAFHCQSLGDYHELYLKTGMLFKSIIVHSPDICIYIHMVLAELNEHMSVPPDVLLLADIFESFRNVCLENYGLDAAHYVSSPHLTWDAMLKMTECELELISDPEIFRTLDGGIRGGISMISKRYARANNKLLGDANFDPSKPTSYIIYLDANNLYGWAMSCALPCSGFKWLEEDEWMGIDWKVQESEQTIGYIVVCDLDYPEELHESHNDYPLAVERLNLDFNILSEFQVEIRRKYRIPKTAQNSKLVPNLMKKQKYCCHYQLLRFYLEHGLKLVRIHRVLQFNQAKWLAPYIQKNSTLRASAKNDFEKDFFKLMNNAVYGKTCENQKKRTDIQLVNNDKKRKELTEKPHCLGFKIFEENLAAIDMRKIKALIDKPFYVGFSVLELSKLHMYRFHYDFIRAQYGDSAQLLFTDTDSLMYEIQTEDIYADMWAHKEEYDFAGYPKASPYYDNTNNKVIGKFKDESNGDPILEFIGLRPKMYSYLTVCGPNVKEKHRAKGIQMAASRLLTHEDFKKQLDQPVENYVINRRISAKLHRVSKLISYDS